MSPHYFRPRSESVELRCSSLRKWLMGVKQKEILLLLPNARGRSGYSISSQSPALGVWPCSPILTLVRLFKIHRGESIAIVTLASRYTPSPVRLNCLMFCRIHPVQLFRVFSRPDPRVRVLKWDFLISMPGGGIGDFIAIERIGRRSYRAALAGTHGETRGSHTQGLAVD